VLTGSRIGGLIVALFLFIAFFLHGDKHFLLRFVCVELLLMFT
jgi:hypothetical protein